MKSTFAKPLISKPARIALHAACILRKLATGKPLGFHVEHLLREFGISPIPSPSVEGGDRAM